mmetsp:Transcript_12679/g.26261  ORF Transcript_12679/g.26261 Transcript_12679/m.26261 type:complete len:121 (+) Transcript_12679:460-822(+)
MTYCHWNAMRRLALALLLLGREHTRRNSRKCQFRRGSIHSVRWADFHCRRCRMGDLFVDNAGSRDTTPDEKRVMQRSVRSIDQEREQATNHILQPHLEYDQHLDQFSHSTTRHNTQQFYL